MLELATNTCTPAFGLYYGIGMILAATVQEHSVFVFIVKCEIYALHRRVIVCRLAGQLVVNEIPFFLAWLRREEYCVWRVTCRRCSDRKSIASTLDRTHRHTKCILVQTGLYSKHKLQVGPERDCRDQEIVISHAWDAEVWQNSHISFISMKSLPTTISTERCHFYLCEAPHSRYARTSCTL